LAEEGHFPWVLSGGCGILRDECGPASGVACESAGDGYHGAGGEVGGLQHATRRLQAGQPRVRPARAAANGPAGAQGHADQRVEQWVAGNDRHRGVRGVGASVGRGDLRTPVQAARPMRRPGG
jgi:hypothetical protein